MVTVQHFSFLYIGVLLTSWEMLCIVVNVSYMCRSEERGCVSACVQGCCVSAGGGETTLFNIDPAAKERLISFN